ncbi:MAG: acylphosphatase [Lachnospiraceae bacterium]
MLVRKHYYVSGRVQGVGFRYRAYYTANSLGLTGYAINLDDGRVELEVQGDANLVRDFLGRVEEGSFIHIDAIESYDMEVQTSDRKFYID